MRNKPDCRLLLAIAASAPGTSPSRTDRGAACRRLRSRVLPNVLSARRVCAGTGGSGPAGASAWYSVGDLTQLLTRLQTWYRAQAQAELESRDAPPDGSEPENP